MKRSRLNKKLRLKRFSQPWYDKFADAFYDEDYATMSKMIGRKVTNQKDAEQALIKLSLKRPMVRGRLM